MDDITPLIPFLDDAGATIVIFLLVWFSNKQNVRQHERTLARDRAMMDTIDAQNKAIMECVRDREVATPRT